MVALLGKRMNAPPLAHAKTSGDMAEDNTKCRLQIAGRHVYLCPPDGLPLSMLKGDAELGSQPARTAVRRDVLLHRACHQLLVTARLSNGRQEDLTDKVLYLSNNPEVVKVSSEGLVEAVKPGETAVSVRAPGFSSSVRFGVVSRPLTHYPKVERRNFIDEFVFAKLRRFQIIPSELSSDAEFLRRVCLDVTGTLPPPRRVREFLLDKDPQKREKVLEILLQSAEYVDYWTFLTF